MRKDHDFEAQKEALMKEVREVLQEVESLYETSVESGTDEAKAIKEKAKEQLSKVKAQFADFEASASEKARDAADHMRDAAYHAAERAREAGCYASDRARGIARQTDEIIQDKPYYAMGFAALAGLVVGILLNRR